MRKRRLARPRIKARAVDPRHPRALFWGLICLLTGLLLLVAGQGFSASLTPEEFQLEKEVWTRPPGDHADLEKRVSRIIQLKPGSAFGHYLMARPKLPVCHAGVNKNDGQGRPDVNAVVHLIPIYVKKMVVPWPQ